MDSLSLMLLIWLNDKVDNICSQSASQCEAFCSGLKQKNPKLEAQVLSCVNRDTSLERSEEIESFIVAVLSLYEAIVATEGSASVPSPPPNQPAVNRLAQVTREVKLAKSGSRFPEETLKDNGFNIPELSAPMFEPEHFEADKQTAHAVPSNSTSIPNNGTPQNIGSKPPYSGGSVDTDILHGEYTRPSQSTFTEANEVQPMKRLAKAKTRMDLKPFIFPQRRPSDIGRINIFELVTMKYKEICLLGRLRCR